MTRMCFFSRMYMLNQHSLICLFMFFICFFTWSIMTGWLLRKWSCNYYECFCYYSFDWSYSFFSYTCIIARTTRHTKAHFVFVRKKTKTLFHLLQMFQLSFSFRVLFYGLFWNWHVLMHSTYNAFVFMMLLFRGLSMVFRGSSLYMLEDSAVLRYSRQEEERNLSCREYMPPVWQVCYILFC
jgi:hypothetical protein